MDDPLFNYEPEKAANEYKGYSAIVYSCREWQKSVEKYNKDQSYAE